MICILDETPKAEKLFGETVDSLIISCLQKVMGTIYVTDPANPLSAMSVLADFVFYAGIPDRELVVNTPHSSHILVPQNESWGEMIESCFPEAVKEVRYAIKKDTHFSREKLKKMAASLPDNYLIRRINPEIYDMCLENSIFKDCVCHFGSKEAFLEAGRGFAVMKDGRLVSACSSYTRYREGFELEVDTVKEERRKGLAGAVSAAMILSCISDGLYPSWDAMNMESVHLAEKLGYEFSHEYTCYWVEQR